MKNKTGIIREGISKKGERRVAITPEYAKHIIKWGTQAYRSARCKS